jgi:DNA-binding beta-propeller fold protein YncE
MVARKLNNSTRRPLGSALGLLLVLGLLWPAVAPAYEKIRVDYEFAIEGAAGLAFEQPTDLALVGEELYVLDGLNHRVAVFDLQGNFRRQFGNRQELGRAIGLCDARSPQGGVYVADIPSARLHHYDGRGALRQSLAVAPVREREKPDITDCAVSAANEIFLVDNNNHRVQVYSREGERQRHWGGFGEAAGQFRFPATIAIDRDGVVFVVDVINNQVKGFRASGQPAQWLGGWGITPGRLFRPKGVLVIADRVLVSDSYTGVIQVFRSSGRFEGLLTGADGEITRFRTPTNMAFAGNRLYVVEQLLNRVSVWRLEP